MTYQIQMKVDTDAIARNGKLPKDGSAEYEPAIIMLVKDDFGEIVDEQRVHKMVIEGPVVVWQDDLNPGATDRENKGARVWLECHGKVETETYNRQPPA